MRANSWTLIIRGRYTSLTVLKFMSLMISINVLGFGVYAIKWLCVYLYTLNAPGSEMNYKKFRLTIDFVGHEHIFSWVLYNIIYLLFETIIMLRRYNYLMLTERAQGCYIKFILILLWFINRNIKLKRNL